MSGHLTELQFKSIEEYEKFKREAEKPASSQDKKGISPTLLSPNEPGDIPSTSLPTDVIHPDADTVKAVQQSIEFRGAAMGLTPRQIENIRMQAGFGTLDLSTHPAFKGSTPEQLAVIQDALIRQPLSAQQLRV